MELSKAVPREEQPISVNHLPIPSNLTPNMDLAPSKDYPQDARSIHTDDPSTSDNFPTTMISSKDAQLSPSNDLSAPNDNPSNMTPTGTQLAQINQPPPSTLNKFPPEIREKIFKLCLHWNGKTPSLIAAMRCNKELYGEVMDIFYNKMENAFVLSRRNGWEFGEMSVELAGRVKRLEIHWGYNLYRVTTPYLRTSWAWAIEQRSKLANVQQLSLCCCACEDTSFFAKTALFLKHLHLRNLNTFSLDLLAPCLITTMHSCGVRVEQMVKRIQTVLAENIGSEFQLTRASVSTRTRELDLKDIMADFRWKWEAGGVGKTLRTVDWKIGDWKQYFSPADLLTN